MTKTHTRITRRDSCRLCGASDLEVALSLAPTPIGDAYVPRQRLGEVQECFPLDVYLCRRCGHSQLLDVIDPTVLYADYIYVTSSSLGLVEHFESYANHVLARVNPPMGALVVDIGSNDGTLLRFFQQRGMHVLGVDPAREIAIRVGQSGIETLPDFFTADLGRKIRRERGPAAVVTANNVLANCDDLDDMIDGIHALLAPDGVFVFEVFYLVDLMQNVVFDFIYHEHLDYHTVKPLAAFFQRHGMELVDIERVSTKGGSLRGIVQVAGGPRSVSASIGTLLALEKDLAIHSVETFRAFSVQINGVRDRLLRLLRDLKEQGKMIAGYGASCSVTTLMYHFQLFDLLDFVVDDNPAKQGLSTPGCHIPVFSPQLLYERRPDYVVILAWRYFEPIIRQHREFLAQGGHFIVPLPQVEVV